MFDNDNNRGKFDLNDEMSRGYIYRGGEDQQNFLKGYATGWVIFIAVIGVVWCLAAAGIVGR